MRKADFICAGWGRGSFVKPVAAPWFRKEFQAPGALEEAQLVICGLGFYRLYINGKDITGAVLAPYMSNTQDLVYYNRYDLKEKLSEGENVLGVLLGNGLQNALGGGTWDFDSASFQSEPKLSFVLIMKGKWGEKRIVSDETVMVHPSPIWFNDLWYGEYYDARREVKDWCLAGKDLKGWQKAVKTARPEGEARFGEALPVVESGKLMPLSIRQSGEGYLYDFGYVDAGVCSLHVKCPYAGQEITLLHGEYVQELEDGTVMLDTSKITFLPEGLGQMDRYVCRGEKMEEWQPLFTYHGFRYVLVRGITAAQANEGLLVFHVMHGDIRERGNFESSDPVLNKVQEMTRRSTLSNYYFYPTDCPQREKNGWTGDACLSAEQMMLNLEPDRSHREWLRNIRKAQREDGMLPGIVPTGGWGMGLGGPAWDGALICLPYYLWKYRGDRQTIYENVGAMLRYLRYLGRSRRPDGLLEIGLGDWMSAGKTEPRDFASPVSVTDTALAYDLCRKMCVMLEALELREEYREIHQLGKEFYHKARELLVDWDSFEVAGCCQTSQAVFLHCGIFRPQEEQRAFEALLNYIAAAGDHMDVGIIGGRALFHVLSAHGRGELAYRMITRTDGPSYGNWVARGASTLWENFIQDEKEVNSRNHHMWGDISSWMIQRVAGIQYNPSGRNLKEVRICPDFLPQIRQVRAWHETNFGRISVSWQQDCGERQLLIQLPWGMRGELCLGKDEEPMVLYKNGGERYERYFEEDETTSGSRIGVVVHYGNER